MLGSNPGPLRPFPLADPSLAHADLTTEELNNESCGPGISCEENPQATMRKVTSEDTQYLTFRSPITKDRPHTV